MEQHDDILERWTAKSRQLPHYFNELFGLTEMLYRSASSEAREHILPEIVALLNRFNEVYNEGRCKLLERLKLIEDSTNEENNEKNQIH